MPSMAQDLTSLSPTDKHKLADYVKSCELTKKNSETYASAYQSCVSREAGSSDVSSKVLAGVGGVILGLLLGKAIGGK